jgi:crossover junction endodeoxyribonuclease RuvC
MGTAQVAGLAMVAAARRGVPVALHTPSEVKAAVTGSGRAGKEQVQRMVASILRLDDLPRPADAADALALAITHLWRPAGALQGGERHELTPAQRAWAAAEHAARTGPRGRAPASRGRATRA